jgi:hypothetical protein
MLDVFLLGEAQGEGDDWLGSEADLTAQMRSSVSQKRQMSRRPSGYRLSR